MCFDPIRTEETRGDLKLLTERLVNLTIPSGSTHRDEVDAIAIQYQPPIAIESLDESLSEKRFVRGKFGARIGAFRLTKGFVEKILD